jgi:hypothetical protein
MNEQPRDTSAKDNQKWTTQRYKRQGQSEMNNPEIQAPRTIKNQQPRDTSNEQPRDTRNEQPRDTSAIVHKTQNELKQSKTHNTEY